MNTDFISKPAMTEGRGGRVQSVVLYLVQQLLSDRITKIQFEKSGSKTLGIGTPVGPSGGIFAHNFLGLRLSPRSAHSTQYFLSMPQSRLILPDDFLRKEEPIVDLKRYLHKQVKVALGLGRTPWEIPVAYDPNCGLPCNVRTRGRYRGINVILLCDTYHTHDYRSKWWGTKEDWASIGATVKHEEGPTIIAHFVGDDLVTLEERRVFNAHQVKGADRYVSTIKEVVLHDDADFGLMGMLLEHHNPTIRYDQADEFSGPDYNGYMAPWPWTAFPNHAKGDYIMIQSVENFPNKATHYSVLLHEMIHWAEVRTGWIHCMAVREFVAEMGMHILGLELGIPHALDQHNRYQWQGEWTQIAYKDHTFFLQAASQVDRASDFLLAPILGRRQFHDPWCVTPQPNMLNSPDGMSFEAVQ